MPPFNQADDLHAEDDHSRRLSDLNRISQQWSWGPGTQVPAEPPVADRPSVNQGSPANPPAKAVEGISVPPAPDSLGIAVIGPDERFLEQGFRPRSLPVRALKPIPYYPALDQVSAIARLGHNVFILDLDSNPEVALKLVEGFSHLPNAVVMAVSNNLSMDVVIRCMQAGTRECLPLPVGQEQLEEAMARAHSRISAHSAKVPGGLCVFLGAKGGSGTTTIASNFAMAAALASGKRVLLIDFDLPLGDAGLNFGIQSEFSTIDALESHQRLDGTLLNHYVTRHESGLFILPALGRYAPCQMTKEAIDKVVGVARQEFECVVLDAGTRFDLADTAIFHDEAQIYLVSQTGIADLRNSSRILSQFVTDAVRRNVQVVLNRDTSEFSLDEELLAKALTQSVQWRVPNDFKAVREMQNTGVPIAMRNSPISQAIGRMARTGLDLSPEPEKKKKKVLRLF